MWIKAQDGSLINSDKIISINILETRLFAVTGYDSLTHTDIVTDLGYYEKSDVEKVRDVLYCVLDQPDGTFTMPPDGVKEWDTIPISRDGE
jgi:hypothetical protein